jgi:NAD-dependent dihydropyrimidine dehydrogenase PreA subunit
MPDLPALDATRCTGSECLEMSAGRPWMPRPADCVSCSVCVLVCPTGALRMQPSSAEK